MSVEVTRNQFLCAIQGIKTQVDINEQNNIIYAEHKSNGERVGEAVYDHKDKVTKVKYFLMPNFVPTSKKANHD